MAVQYRYDIEARYLYKDSEIIISKENIKTLMIDYEYEDKNMPILIMKCSIDKNVIDDMVENNKKKYITLRVTKYIKDSPIKVTEKYIYYQFSYFLDSDTINSIKDLDYANDTKNNEDIRKQINIGLMLQEVIDSNKKIINSIHNNQTLLEILLCYLSDRKILIEDSKDYTIYNNVIIPPMNTITSFVKYMNDQYNFYSGTGYRLFYDFDKTYLLSSKGNGVPSKDEKYNTVIFTVNKTSSKDSKNLGVSVDKVNNCYSIDLDTTDIEIYENSAVPKTYGTIMGIDTEGNTTTEELDLEGANSTNVRIERTNNLSHIKALKSKIENNVIVNITKTELDTTIFTINKEYYIKNYNKQNNQIGKFILTNKREVYTRDSDSFILTLLLTFKKISKE